MVDRSPWEIWSILMRTVGLPDGRYLVDRESRSPLVDPPVLAGGVKQNNLKKLQKIKLHLLCVLATATSQPSAFPLFDNARGQ